MTYKERYYAIINNRKANPLPKDQYGEKHHIKPKSLYPELASDKNNIVRLSAFEHYLCHFYLVKIYEEEGNTNQKNRMLYAFSRMNRLLNDGHLTEEEAKMMGAVYARLKEEIRIAHRAQRWSEEAKIEASIRRRNRRAKWWNNGTKEVQRAECPEGFVRGKLKGKMKWFNNGETSIRAKECPEGFIPGRLPLSKEQKDKIGKTCRSLELHWFTNGEINVFQKDCPEGFRPGRPHRLKKASLPPKIS